MPDKPLFIRNILLIDDDEDDFMLFEMALKAIDPTIEVTHIASPRNFPARIVNRVPDLLFLDINMPEKNGFEWLKAIRERGCTVPVIIYSTASNPGYVEKAYREGASVFFPKPDSFALLQESLLRLLNLNWTAPAQITERFCSDGVCRVFSLS